MGANSTQGWLLFLFLIGFTFLPAGFVGMGWPFEIAGLACLIASAVGFYGIKPLEQGSQRQTQSIVVAGKVARAERQRA